MGEKLTETVERPVLNGWTVPERIWLMDLGCGDVTWCADPDPDGEQVDSVEYVLAALSRPNVEEGVTQADRDAAANLIEDYWSGADASMMKLARSYREGHSHGAFVRAFRAHRVAALRGSGQ